MTRFVSEDGFELPSPTDGTPPTWQRWGRAAVAVVAAGAMLVVQTAALAQDAMTKAGRSGESYGMAISRGTLPTVDGNGAVTLFPGSSNAQSTFNTQELFPGASGSLDGLKGAYQNGSAALTKQGQDSYATLKTSTTPEGQAVSVVRGSVTQSRPDLRNDPVFGATDKVLSNIDTIAKNFSDCSVDTIFKSTTDKAHLDDIRTCERVNDTSGQCTLIHDYSVGVLEAVSGETSFESCGEGCLDFYVGKIGNNYWKGEACGVHNVAVTVRLVAAEAITSATLEYVKWDDYIQVYIGDNVVWSGPPETGPRPANCDLMSDFEFIPNLDVKSSFAKNGLLKFGLKVTVGKEGEGYARIRIRYDTSKAVQSKGYSPTECYDRMKKADDKFCKVTFECTDQPTLDANGCSTINGVLVCPSNFTEPVANGFSPLCRSTKVTTTCDFWEGQAECWTDPTGVQHCPTVSGNAMPVDTCKQLEAQGCGFISSECVGGAKGASGTCYVNEERWDCGGDVDVPSMTQERTYDCKGPLRCQGTECVDANNETNPDFAKAAAALQASRFMAMDNDCASEDPDIVSKCQVFKGNAQTCKKVFGGIVDCCSPKSAGTNLGDYMTLAFAMRKADTAIMAMDKTSAVRGAWETLRTPVTEAWSSVKTPIVESWNSIWDGYAGVCKAAACWDGAGHMTYGETVSKGFLHEIEQGIMQEVSQWVGETFGAETYSMLFEVTATGDVVLGGIIGTALGWIMWAYMIYQITMILIKIIWECTKEEFQLNVNKQLRNCHFIGSYCASKAFGCVEKRESYCCFNSPLSRIIQEQARPQLGTTFGTPENPECGGLTVDDLQRIDWNKVDLSEWMGILSSTGHMPDPNAITSDSLTKNNFFQDANGTRRNVETRSTDRLNGIDGAGVRSEASKQYRMGIN
ncbi:conjugal transfer mating pair stabilization protein TraN [Azospirillum sp. sgz302134]